MPADKPTELSRIKLKTWTRQPVPMISKHSAHSTLLPIGFRTWLWPYTCLLLLISMLWHRQAIFESKGDKKLVGLFHSVFFKLIKSTCMWYCSFSTVVLPNFLLQPLCEGNPLVTGGFQHKGLVMWQGHDVIMEIPCYKLVSCLAWLHKTRSQGINRHVF